MESPETALREKSQTLMAPTARIDAVGVRPEPAVWRVFVAAIAPE